VEACVARGDGEKQGANGGTVKSPAEGSPLLRALSSWSICLRTDFSWAKRRNGLSWLCCAFNLSLVFSSTKGEAMMRE
jgi:hypothetical protein